MKRSRNQWLIKNSLDSKEKVLRYIEAKPNQRAVAVGEWNRENPNDKIDAGEEEQEGVDDVEKEEEAPNKKKQRREKKERIKKRRADAKSKKALEVFISNEHWGHILEHINFVEDKSIHGIYLNGDKKSIGSLIREAVVDILEGSNRVLAREPRRRGKPQAFVVNMGRKIGTMSGRERNGEDAMYLLVEIIPTSRGPTIVKNAFPVDTTNLKHGAEA